MNYLMTGIGIIVAAISNIIVGTIWYSPKVFGNLWLRLNKVPLDTAAMQRAIVGNTLSAVVMAAIMACFMDRMHINTVLSGFHFGWMAWTGFVAPVTLQGVLYARRPFLEYLLNNGYNLTAMIVMGMILSLFI